MNQGLEQFAWSRPLEGYVWEDAVALDTTLLQSKDPRDKVETRFLRWRHSSSRAVSFTPLQDHPTLFLEFAHLEPTEATFLEFADKYGWLGVPIFLENELTRGRKTVVFDYGDLRSQGEALWQWREAHRQLSRVSSVLEAILDKNIDALKQWFHIDKNGVRYERADTYGMAYEWVCSPDVGRASMHPARWKWGDKGRAAADKVLRFASVWVQKEINGAMSGAEGGTMTSVRVLINVPEDRMMLHIVPDSLLAAMWLQCARALTETPTFKGCENCGKWFEVSADARRKGSMYCSARCKVAAYRHRIQEGKKKTKKAKGDAGSLQRGIGDRRREKPARN